MANLSDSFSGADQNPIATPNWAFVNPEYEGARLVSHQFVKTASLISASLSWRTDSQNNYSQFTYGTVSATNNDSGPAIHCQNSGAHNNYYYLSIYQNGSFYSPYIALHNGGSDTGLYDPGTDIGFTPTTATSLRIYRSGSNIVADYNNGSGWVNIATVADTTLSGGFDGGRIGFVDDAALVAWANYDTFAGVTVNLTGQAATTAGGAIIPARALSPTGQSATTAAGILIPARSLAPTGQAATASLGTLASSRSVPLVGQSATAAQGSVSAGSNVNASLTGQVATAASGTVSTAVSLALAGVAATTSTGTVVPAHAALLVGQAVSAATGTITADPESYVTVIVTPDPTSAYRITAVADIASGDWVQYRAVGGGTPPTGLSVLDDATWQFSSGNYPVNFDVRVWDHTDATWGSWATQSIGVAAALTGQAATSAGGSMGNGHSVPFTGQAATTSAGTVTRTSSVALTGSALTASTGTSLASLSIALSGLALAVSQGTIAVSAGSNITVALTGLGATAAAGAVQAAITAAMSGQSATASAGSVTPGKSFGLTGQQVTASQGSMALAAAFQLVGTALATSQGSMAVTAGGNVTVNLTGSAIAAALGTLTVAHSTALVGQSVAASAGTVAMLRALALLGIPCTISQGTVTFNDGQNVTVALSGLEMSLTDGDVSAETARALAGISIDVQIGTIYALAPAIGGSSAPFPSVEGQVASPNPVSIILNPMEGTPVAGENGCIIGRFGRMDQNGEVWNGHRVDHETLGFVLAWPGGWGSVYWTDGRPVMRAGLPITIAAGGDFWARFSGGAVSGARVYARLVDGAAVSGYAADCEPTPWYVVTQAAAGELAIISTYSRVQ